MRVPKFTIAFVLFLTLSTSASAQFQRMALALGEYVARAGSEAVLNAYCIDPDRDEPRDNRVFTHSYGNSDAVQIEYQNRKYSIREAAAAGIGEFVGRGLDGVAFRPKVPGDVRIIVNGLDVLSDREDPPTPEHIAAVKPIITSAPKESPKALLQHDDTQTKVWAKVDELRHRTEIRQQQILLRDLGFDVGNLDGTVGPNYRTAIQKLQRDYPKESWSSDLSLALVDVAAPSGHDLSAEGRQIVKDAISRRLASVGFSGADNVVAFSRYHGLASEDFNNPEFINKLKSDEDVVDSMFHPWAVTGGIAIAAERSAFGRTVLVNRNGPEAWTFESETVSRARGSAAIELIDEKSAEAASKASRDGNLFIYPSRIRLGSGTRLRIQVGKIAITPTEGEMKEFLSGKSDLPELSAAIQSSRTSDGKPAVLVYRGAIERAESDIQKAGFGADVPRVSVDTAQFAADLRRRLAGIADVYLASDTSVSNANARSQPVIAQASDLAVFKGEKIQDWGAINDLANAFRQANIHVAIDDLGTIKAENVIIFTGHRDANLDNYLARLSEDGDLDDKLVVLFSCHAATCEVGQSRVLQALDGPRGIVYFPDQIDSTAVTLVLKEVAVLLKGGKIQPTNIAGLIDQSVDNALAKARPDLRSEIEKLRRMIIQVSELLDDSVPSEKKA